VNPLSWILLGGVLMTAIGLVGGLTLVLGERTLRRILLPLVAVSAGSLIGGALFHMLPEALERIGRGISAFAWLGLGFVAFFCLEQFLHWHHCHRTTSEHKHPVTYLLLVSDTTHNFVDGLAVGAAFMIDVHLGITTWLVAAAHEVPQELGDFGALVHGGWPPRRALIYNCASQATFLLGGLAAYAGSRNMDLSFVVAFAAGSFLYIGAVDLVPEINKHPSIRTALLHFLCFAGGMALLFGLAFLEG
jgi:zinc and cadmium transporter